MARVSTLPTASNCVSICIASRGVLVQGFSINAEKCVKTTYSDKRHSYPYSVPASMLCSAVPCWFFPNAILSSSESDIPATRKMNNRFTDKRRACGEELETSVFFLFYCTVILCSHVSVHFSKSSESRSSKCSQGTCGALIRKTFLDILLMSSPFSQNI